MPKVQVIDATNAAANQATASWWNRLRSVMGGSDTGKRDYYDIYDYPLSLADDTGFERMYERSRRHGIANRLTFGTARSCWRDGFEIRNDEDDDGSQELEDELTLLNSVGMLEALERADILNRIGRFSLLLVGTQDVADLAQPLQSGAAKLENVYFQPFAYDGITVSAWVSDTADRRFGQPELYNVQRRDRGTAKNQPGMTSRLIHWSRVVHMSEGALDNDTEGMGYLEPIYNRIVDLDKATGGSAEAYFRNARNKIGYEIDPEFASQLLTDEKAKEAFDEGAAKFTNQWQDHTIAAGATIKNLETTQASPADTVKAALWEIAGYTGYPIRVLTGEGSGQLAGSEDQLAVNAIIADRQRVVCAGWARRALEILAEAGLLTFDPAWTIYFPPQQASTEIQQAEVNNKLADTLQKVTAAKSSIGGDEINIDSALEVVGLGEIELEEPDDLEPLPVAPVVPVAPVAAE